ncbi:MAG: hypothetical protein U7M05_01535 [Candidatus Igneacidithiobacillus chanchocoensis]
MQIKQKFLPTLGIWLVLHGTVALADSASANSLSIPKAAPKSALIIQSKGMGDPYPEAERLVRFNGERLLDNDYQGMRAYDSSGAFYQGSVITEDPRYKQLEDSLAKSLASCQRFDSKRFPPGVTFSSDLHDFVVPLKALQTMFALRGKLFLPLGTDDWKLLSMSAYTDGEFTTPDDGSRYIQTKAQSFYRAVYFLTTATPEEVHDAIVGLAADRGYKEVIWPKDPSLHIDPIETIILNQRVTPNVTNACLITNERDAYPNLNICYKNNIGDKHNHNKLRIGSILQISAIPLGEKTEQFTNAYVDDRLARERNMTPEQIAEERKEIEERTFREAAKKAPYFQNLMKKVAQGNAKVAQSSIQVRDNALPEFQRDLHRLAHGLGVSGEWIDPFINKARSDMSSAAQFARQAADYAQRRLQSIWE